MHGSRGAALGDCLPEFIYIGTSPLYSTHLFSRSFCFLLVFFYTPFSLFPDSNADMSPDIPVAAAAAARDVSSPTDFTISTPATASLGPLETVFTPASACSMLFSSSPFLLSYTEMLPLQQGRHCEGDIDMPDVTGCWPPATATISASIGFDLLGRGYYSPGIYFPIGYETACSGGHTDAGYFVWTPGPSGTAIGCCPTYVCLPYLPWSLWPSPLL